MLCMCIAYAILADNAVKKDAEDKAIFHRGLSLLAHQKKALT